MVVRGGGGGGGGAAFVVCAGASVVGTAVGDDNSDGDSDGDVVGNPVSGVSGRSSCVDTTPMFDLGGADDFDGAGPTIAPSAVRPPQQNTSVEAIPNPTTDTIRCWFDIRAHSAGNPTMSSFPRDRSSSWQRVTGVNIGQMAGVRDRAVPRTQHLYQVQRPDRLIPATSRRRGCGQTQATSPSSVNERVHVGMAAAASP